MCSCSVVTKSGSRLSSFREVSRRGSTAFTWSILLVSAFCAIFYGLIVYRRGLIVGVVIVGIGSGRDNKFEVLHAGQLIPLIKAFDQVKYPGYVLALQFVQHHLQQH